MLFDKRILIWTEKNVWKGWTIWAKLNGRKTALTTFDTEEDARAFILASVKGNPGKYKSK